MNKNYNSLLLFWNLSKISWLVLNENLHKLLNSGIPILLKSLTPALIIFLLVPSGNIKLYFLFCFCISSNKRYLAIIEAQATGKATSSALVFNSKLLIGLLKLIQFVDNNLLKCFSKIDSFKTY